MNASGYHARPRFPISKSVSFCHLVVQSPCAQSISSNISCSRMINLCKSLRLLAGARGTRILCDQSVFDKGVATPLEIYPCRILHVLERMPSSDTIAHSALRPYPQIELQRCHASAAWSALHICCLQLKATVPKYPLVGPLEKLAARDRTALL